MSEGMGFPFGGDPDDLITVVHFSQINEPGIGGFGTLPSPN